MRKSVFGWSAVCLALAAACGVDDAASDVSDLSAQVEKPASEPGAEHGHAAVTGQSATQMPSWSADETLTWKTEEFEVKPGKDRYLCYSKTLEEDTVVDAYVTGGAPFIHHLIFSRARSPQPVGFEECNTAFRSAWDPVFITGAGAAKLEFPVGAGHKLPKGTQLVVQMHLLNTEDEPVRGALEIKMHRAKTTTPRPVNSYIFGSAAVKLAPKSKGQVIGTCRMFEPVKLIAAFPHMHMLGTSLKFEVGQSEETMKEVFKRDPFTFDNQAIENVTVDLKAGDITRVTCNYNNTTDKEVSYGESTLNEMCYLIGFAIDRPFQGACIAVIPPGVFR